MDKKQYGSKFRLLQDMYFKVTWLILFLSIVSFGSVYLLLNMSIPAPEILAHLIVFLLYYHFGHFAYGILSLIYYLLRMRNKVKELKVYKTVIGIFVTPVSFFAVYIAVFLILFSSCSAN